MAAVGGRLRRMAGSFHYKKWVLFYRYQQTFHNTSTPLFHIAVAMTFVGMFNESRRRNASLEAAAYRSRREKVMDSLNRGWMAEREQQSLDIDELEAAVYRSRTSTWPKDLMTTTSKDGEEMP
eukprot:CAMPEP_0197676552 /NCGR_PEP_ID=MMETSP1338-20131121/87005_1 /TAXON_ID=43686 ORGANISM="Pelagodinium beii, Strain RCC1491" /NCGR_SAMPLE_ID=MMETSP1338 /ASSEMBLY_ACC=CAM_ASM_000754 /LENGTH=122 /DNA_ID=CAMNT_0043257249 /DNA_START=92 /DNA_END=456 /DNA_ORIENTATION=-